MKSFITIVIAILFASISHGQWVKQNVDTTASLRGLSVVNEKVVWASGTGGTVIRTVDGGKSWKVMTVPGAEKLDFRDVEAFDANTAYILSIGNGESSRIYKTIDGGATWKEQFRNKNEKAFFDAIACFDIASCIAMSDPVDGRFVLIRTDDDGDNWKPVNTVNMPPAKEGEAAFAASGSCLIARANGEVFLASGGSHARVFRSANQGKDWSVASTPLVSGSAGSGIFSIAMRGQDGVIVGGDYEKPDAGQANLAFTSDGGRTWSLGKGLTGYRSSIVYVGGQMVAVGTNGSDISSDGGRTWRKLGTENLNSVARFATLSRQIVWAVGPQGLVVRLIGLPGSGGVDPPKRIIHPE